MRWIQQTHKGCGGGIVVVAREGWMRLACDACGQLWKSDAPVSLPSDYQDAEDVREIKKPAGISQ